MLFHDGPELNACLAEHILGEKWVLYPEVIHNGKAYKSLPTWARVLRDTDANNLPAGTMLGGCPPQYTSDIRLAEKILIRIREFVLRIAPLSDKHSAVWVVWLNVKPEDRGHLLVQEQNWRTPPYLSLSLAIGRAAEHLIERGYFKNGVANTNADITDADLDAT